MKTFAKIGAVAAVSLAALAGVAVAQDVTKAADQAAAQAAADARLALMEEMGDEMEKITPMLRNQAPFDAAAITALADFLAEHAPEIGPDFAIDTTDFDIETKARDAVWASHDAFLDKAEALETAIAALQTAAAGGERPAITRAMGAVGQSCGSCHDDYKDD